MTSTSTTLLKVPSHIGLKPMRAKSWQMSSPPFLIVEVPQIEIARCERCSPFSCRYSSIICSALLFPKSHAVSVGIALISTEKKFLPVGKTSNFPLVGAPEGPLEILFPSKALRKLVFSLSELVNSLGKILFNKWFIKILGFSCSR